MREDFLRLVGPVPDDVGNPFRRRRRLHQGWWRTAVLHEEAGANPRSPASQVCNTFNLTDANRNRNYLSEAAVRAVEHELALRQTDSGFGIIQEPRIWNNLLSSQPLCFNFWGPLQSNHALANRLLVTLIPHFGELRDIAFERKPGANYTNDHSAFDVMIEYLDTSERSCLLGLECKYTDELMSKPYDRPEYRLIFEQAKPLFAEPYEFYVQPDFNQLFRNQLMACAHEQTASVYCQCGLFCSRDDEKALKIGRRFQTALVDGETRFLIITYEQFIASLQSLDVNWETRVWSMLLWARYLGLELSEAAYGAHVSAL